MATTNERRLYDRSILRLLIVVASGTVGASNLVAGSPPAINGGGVASSSAFGGFTSVAPGSWIEIYGTDLATDTRSWANSDFNGVNAPTSLDGTSVTVGGQPAFVAFVSPTQVNVQVPSSVATGSQLIIVTANGVASAPYPVMVNSEEPGLFAPSSFVLGGNQYTGAFFSDGTTYVLRPGAIAGVTSRRAVPGDTITLYGIGFGPVIPSIPAGQIVQQTNSLSATLQIMFGQALATITYEGLAPGAVGLYQFNVVVPNVPSSDTIPLTFTLGGVAGKQKLYIAVQSGSSGPQLQSLTLSPTSISGGGNVQGTITLSQPAPAGGAIVALTTNSSSLTVPSTVTIPAAATSGTFTVSTSAVTSNQTGTITATYGGTSVQATLTITPGLPLPHFTLLQINGNMTLADGSAVKLTVNLYGSSPGGYACGFAGAWMGGNIDYLANAYWSTFSTNGLTVTCSGLNIITSVVYELNTRASAEFTSGSLAVTLNPQTVSTSGTASGSVNLVSTLATINGSFNGTYIVLAP